MPFVAQNARICLQGRWNIVQKESSFTTNVPYDEAIVLSLITTFFFNTACSATRSNA